MVEQVRNGEISGSPDDERVRELLLAGARNSLDPGIRVDAVEMLAGQNSEDVRDALISSVENDPNAAVRMKALEGLRQFSNDIVTRDALKFVLSHDRDAGVRSEAIDVLVPADRTLTMTPELLQTLQDVIRAGQDDDYVHARCLQALQGVKAQADAY
jgi:HEAT repeat protein